MTKSMGSVLHLIYRPNARTINGWYPLAVDAVRPAADAVPPEADAPVLLFSDVPDDLVPVVLFHSSIGLSVTVIDVE